MSPTSPTGFARFPPLMALRHPAYRLLLLGTLPGLLAMQMSMVALGYLAFALSGSATALGFIGLGWGLPLLGLSLAGGVVADRLPRRTIMLGTQATIGAAALLGAVLLLAGIIQVWHLFLIALLQGTAFAFNMPARQALVGDLVSPADLGNAIALNNAAMNLTRVVGPPIAGVVIGAPAVGVTGAFLLMAALYVVVLLVFARLPRRAAPGRAGRSGWHDLQEGLRFIRHSPVLRGLLALAFAQALLGMPYQLLLPVFALSIFQAGPEGLGLLGMASGLGALAGSVGVTVLAASRHRWLLQVGLGLGVGGSLVGFALSSSLLPAALLLAVTGATSAGFMSLNNALLMEATPGQLHGRVMSVYMMTVALMPLTSLPAAGLVDRIGASLTVGGMGGLLVLASLVIGLWQRRATMAALRRGTATAAD